MGEQSVKELYQKQIQEAENKKVLVEKEIDDVKRKCRILRDKYQKNPYRTVDRKRYWKQPSGKRFRRESVLSQLRKLCGR